MIYWISKRLFYFYFHCFYRLQVQGLKNIPKKGSIIVCSNHIHAMDPFLVAGIIKRKVHYMAKKELFKHKIVAWYLGIVGAYPVDRANNDIQAMKKTMSLLKNGHALGIFAQGTRVSEGETKDAKAGVALFALKTGTPVIPVYIEGSYRYFKPLKLSIGAPVDLSKYKGKKTDAALLAEASEEVMGQIALLKNISS